MSQNQQGALYAFRLSGSRMRRRALQLRRQGQTLDALTLVRRAAEQDDTPAAWQALATELRQTGNWEAAVQLLARVLSRDPHLPGVWCDMARCLQALGADELAVDCAYHQLQEDPWSPEADAARAILQALETMPEAKEPRRIQRMIHRGLNAWQTGDRPLGERRIRRALHLAADKERLMVTAAMLCMLEMDFDGALRYLPRALRRSPEDPRTLTALSTLYHQLGKRRLARGLLAKAGRYADSVMAEDGFLTAAWAQDAWKETNDYLTLRMKQLPCRTALLAAKATMCCERENLPGARQLWREILAIDPDDRQSAVMNTWAQTHPEGFINAPGLLPKAERQRQLTELRMLAESLTMEDLLRPGSRGRQLTDWFIASSDLQERQTAQQLLEGRTEAAVTAYWKELLCRPFLRMETRHWALVQLARMGCRDEMLMMAGSHYTLVACQPVADTEPQKPWRMFLPALLRETRRYRRSNEIAEFGAEMRQQMSAAQRMEAAGQGSLVWCKAMEILFLRMAGEEEQAARAAANTPLSPRRISRVLRRLARELAAEPVM